MGRLAGFSYREVVRRLRTFGFQFGRKESRLSEGIKAASAAFLDEKGVPLRGVIHPSVRLRSRQEVRERPSARCFYIPALYVSIIKLPRSIIKRCRYFLLTPSNS